MAVRRVSELPAANRLDPADQLLVSTASGGLTRRAGVASLPFKAAAPAAVLRTLTDKLGDLVSVRDFGALGDGASDDTAAFQAALDAHTSVHVPAGTYRLAGEVQVKPRRTIVGAGRDTTVIQAGGARAFTFNRNAGAYAVEPGGSNDWCRSRLAQLSVRMAQGGIKVYGHEFHAEGLRFSGGQAGAWCVELEDANEASLREIGAGTGGGGDDLLANGVRLYGSEAGKGVNYGDSLLEEIAIKLKSPNSTGILIEHTGSASGGKLFVVNNVLLNRVQVNSASPPAGSVGIRLRRVMRSALVNVDLEFLDAAFVVEGAAGGGNAGSCRHLSFINCYVLNCAKPWQDSNAGLAGSVMRNLFSNCNGFGLLNPVGIASDDAAARAGEGDSFLPAGLWLNEPGGGQAAVQLRAANPGQLLLTGDFHDGLSAVRDGNPKNRAPRQALGVDVTSFNVTRLYRPRGWSTGEFARLVIGNGTDFKPDGSNAAPLHRLEIADPLYLAPRASEPPQALNGFAIYCEAAAALPAGSPWIGAGWYTRLSERWQPGTAPLGRLPDKERNAGFTVSPLDFGLVHRVNNSAAVTVTIASTYDLGAGALPLMAEGDPDAILWLVRQGTGDVVVAAGDGNVQIKTPIAGNVTMRVKRQYQLVAVLLRYNAASAKIEVYGNINPDGEFTYEETVGWTNANQGSNTDAAPYVVTAARAGQLLRISSTDAASHVAFDTTSQPAGLPAAIFRLCTLGNPLKLIARSGGGLSLRRTNGTTAPGNLPCFTLSEVGRVLTVHVSGSSNVDGNQPNSIYIEG